MANIRYLRELMELDGLVCVIMAWTHLLRVPDLRLDPALYVIFGLTLVIAPNTHHVW